MLILSEKILQEILYRKKIKRELGRMRTQAMQRLFLLKVTTL